MHRDHDVGVPARMYALSMVQAGVKALHRSHMLFCIFMRLYARQKCPAAAVKVSRADQHKDTIKAWHGMVLCSWAAPVDKLDDLFYKPQHRLQAPNQALEPALLRLPEHMSTW